MDRTLLPPFLAVLAALTLLGGCGRRPVDAGPLVQRGYLWQRDWTPAVAEGFREAEARMNGVVVFGSEVSWADGSAHVVRANIAWPKLRGARVSLAVRMAPYSGAFSADGGPMPTILAEAARLLTAARTNQVKLEEFQLDFDCGQKRLAEYAVWMRALKEKIAPVPLVITALPAWLREPEFPALARIASGYVLQVHSVPTLAESGHAVLCDPALARRWVAEASRIGIPFSVSLPAYWCVAGYDKKGKLLGVAMDSVQPAWPPGTKMLDFYTDPDAIAGLVATWKKDRPRGMTGLLWYRVPVATDRRTWRWPTLAAVMAGRKPEHRVDAVLEGGQPLDISIVNRGEGDERSGFAVTLQWEGAQVTASDALPGWTLTLDANRAVFTTTPGAGILLSPGERRGIGWIRYDKVTVPRWLVEERNAPAD